jgi:hypothetical protein
MLKTQRLTDSPEDRGDLARERTEAASTPGAQRARKPYQRPSFQKRRSMSQATLLSAGGTAGTLTSGG